MLTAFAAVTFAACGMPDDADAGGDRPVPLSAHTSIAIVDDTAAGTSLALSLVVRYVDSPGRATPDMTYSFAIAPGDGIGNGVTPTPFREVPVPWYADHEYPIDAAFVTPALRPDYYLLTTTVLATNGDASTRAMDDVHLQLSPGDVRLMSHDEWDDEVDEPE